MSDAPRFRELDQLRTIAVLLMVQGHVFTELLSKHEQSQPWYDYHRYLHGFTAPMFLFGAGLAFAITTFGRLELHTRWGPEPRRRLVRYVKILAIGYFLHLPISILWGNDPDRAWAEFWIADALHVIAFSMVMCMALVAALARPSRIASAAAVLATTLLFTVEWANAVSAYLPRGLANYFTHAHGSYFPIWPWAGYVFVGLAAGFFFRSRAEWGNPRAMIAALLLGVALVVLGLRWSSDQARHLVHAGGVLLLLPALRVFNVRLTQWTLPVERLGQRSLGIYVAHLLILFAALAIVPTAAERMSLEITSAATAVVFVISLASLELWRRFVTSVAGRGKLLR